MLKELIIFTTGAAVGVGGTYLYLNKKYHERAKAEIEEIREYYRQKAEVTDPVEEPVESVIEPEMVNYTNIISVYTSEPETKTNDKEVIKPFEFGNSPDDDWDEPVTYTMYADDVIVGYAGEILTGEEVEEFIGHENLSRMGEYEPDVLYVRNYTKKTDYEIVRDEETYYNE